ncbi:DNA topoisomerase 2, partial [Friedmanniomyces endolithicus]
VKESAAQQLKQKPVQKKTLVPSRLAAVAPPVAKPLSPAAKAYAAKQAKAGAQTAGQGGKAKAAGTKRLPVDSDTDEGEEEEDVDALANEILSEEDDDDVPVKKGATGARPARRAAAAKPKAKYALDDSLDAEEDDEESEADFEDEDED